MGSISHQDHLHHWKKIHTNEVTDDYLGKSIKKEIIKSNKVPKDLTIDQLRPLLKAIKRAGDKVTPTIKTTMGKCYEQWLERPYLVNLS